MDIAPNLTIPAYSNRGLASTKTDTSLGIAMLNKAQQIQRDAAQQMLQTLQQSVTPTQALPDHLGRRINVTA